MSARELLGAGLTSEALEAFQLGVREFEAPMCAWGEVQVLYALGRDEDAKPKAAELLRRWPKSVPAQFAVKREGEQWYVPGAGLFQMVADERARQ